MFYVQFDEKVEEIMKLSIVVPVYFNEENLPVLYDDIKEKIIDKIDYDYEIVMVNDGSKDKSYDVIMELSKKDKNIVPVSLSRNFGSHAAILCGLSYATGDCIAVKAADLQEPTELLLEMVDKWKEGNNVVLAVREGREEGFGQVLFANMYYGLVRKTSLPNMPKNGFDVWLVDKKVRDVLLALDETNSSITGQILWSGFRTAEVPYVRKAREIGKSRWTLKKKIRLVADTLFSFSSVPIKIVTSLGIFSVLLSIIWAIVELVVKLQGNIDVEGWTMLFVFNLFSFGVIMFSIGILGEYMWRTFDSSRRRPPYIVEDEGNRRGETDKNN